MSDIEGMALGYHVFIDTATWAKSTPTKRMRLLAHELTHVAQYYMLSAMPTIDSFGFLRFDTRYALDVITHRGNGGRENYSMPGSLRNMTFSRVFLLDPRYTLDQLAERVAAEVN